MSIPQDATTAGHAIYASRKTGDDDDAARTGRHSRGGASICPRDVAGGVEVVPPTGLEPVLLASEASALSTELRGRASIIRGNIARGTGHGDGRSFGLR